MGDEKRVYEVEEQLSRLERVCKQLLDSVKALEERCASVLSHAAIGEKSGDTSQPALCPLAVRLYSTVTSIEFACGDIDMLVERIEL